MDTHGSATATLTGDTWTRPPPALPRGPGGPRVSKHTSLQGKWDLPPTFSSAFPAALKSQRCPGSSLLKPSPGLQPARGPPRCGDRVPRPLPLGGWSLSCRRGCQSSGSGLRSSPSELLMLELELERGLGPRLARQPKRKGPSGKIPFREFSRQWSGEGLVAGPSRSHLHCPGLAAPRSLGPLGEQVGKAPEARACGLDNRRLLAGTSPPRCPRWAGSQASSLSPSMPAAEFLGSARRGPPSPAEEQGQAGCSRGAGISLRQFSRPWSGELPTGLPFPGRCPWLHSGLWKSRSPSELLDDEKLLGVPWEPRGRAGLSLVQPCRPRAGRGPMTTSLLCGPRRGSLGL